jgi:hypothetical protein
MYRSHAAPDRSLLVTAFGGRVFGLERGNGQIRWETKVDASSAVEIFLGDGIVIAASLSLLAFIDYATGAIRTSVPLAGSQTGRPTMLVDGEHVYVGSGGEVSCYTLHGNKVWWQPFTGKGIWDVALGLPGNVRQADANT